MYCLCLVEMMVAQLVQVKSPSFASVYNLETQCPHQVEWSISSMDLGTAVREPSWKFLPDVPHDLATARHEDFNHSGYDRGHMCAAADRTADLLKMRSTFALSNCAAQAPRLNRGAWKKTEIECRKQAMKFGTINVLAMPIFLQRDTTFIGTHRVAVPHAFLKVAWCSDNDSIIGIWFLWNK